MIVNCKGPIVVQALVPTISKNSTKRARLLRNARHTEFKIKRLLRKDIPQLKIKMSQWTNFDILNSARDNRPKHETPDLGKLSRTNVMSKIFFPRYLIMEQAAFSVPFLRVSNTTHNWLFVGNLVCEML